jgi:hypothetical protein
MIVAVTALPLVLLACLRAQSFSGDTAPRHGGRPTVQVSNGLFTRGQDDPARRTVVTHRLDLESDVASDASAFAQLAWVQLFDRGRGGATLRTSQIGNVAVGGRLAYSLGSSGRWQGETAVALVFDTSQNTLGDPGSTTSYAHAVAIHGAWDAWLWAQGRPALVLPGRVVVDRPLLARAGELELEYALAFFLPRSDLLESTPHVMLQLGATYTCWLRRWLSVAPRLRTVRMPSVGWLDGQTSVGALVAAGFGRWRLGGEWLANVDAPYGWLNRGQRIAAFHLHLGVWL